MENLCGYELSHPDYDCLASEWYIFTFKHKLYQISISKDQYHNKQEYDIKIYSFNKFKTTDKDRLYTVKQRLSERGVISSNYQSKAKLKAIFVNLNKMMIRKEYIDNVYLSSNTNMLSKSQTFQNKYITDVYYELIMDKL